MKKVEEYIDIEHLKNMSLKELEELASSIRKFLIENLSSTGGHLSSNLGVVELTIALHRVYNSGLDKIIWDVGHQSYIHKILTGRKEQFHTLRKYKGLSGFPKRKESIHDVFDTGHSSTSISAGLGYAFSRDIKGEDYEVISVIGDGAISAGMAFEALNHAGFNDTNLTVILNDNEMSIAENVGGLSKYLYKIRNAKSYYKFKSRFNRVVGSLPKIGTRLIKATEKAKGSLKYFLTPGIFFEEIGFKYLGPVNGHNIEELTEILEISKKVKGPKLVHVITKKGIGYLPAELDPEKYHGVGAFDKETGNTGGGVNEKDDLTYSEVLGNKLLEIGENKKNIVAITAAMPVGTGLEGFKKKFPERFFDVGIAEQHGVTLAAGMAINGIKPFIAIYSTFLQRGYDQILHDVSIQNLPVTFAIDRAGLVGSDGETHHGIFDLSYLSHIPNMTIMSPKDKREFLDMIEFASEYNAPLAIRYHKGSCYDFIDYNDEYKRVQKGISETIIEGQDIAILAIGRMVEVGYNITKLEDFSKINPTLINARFIKPIDLNMVKRISKDYSLIVTLEDNTVIGGFGSLVNDQLLKEGFKGDVLNIGINDVFIEQGDNSELYKEIEMDEESISKRILNKYLKERP